MGRFRRIVIALICMLPLCGLAQEGGMVKWEFKSAKVAVDAFELTAKAVVAEGWHIYAQDSGEGSMPTKFTFATNPLIKLDGKVMEKGELVKKRNEVMESELKYYEDSVLFVQRVTLSPRKGDITQSSLLILDSLSSRKARFSQRERELKGKVEFMVCNDQMCLPPEEVEFTIELK